MKQLLTKDHKRLQALSEITDNLMSRGPANAPVTLEFFADLESPVSRPAEAVIEELLRQYPDRVRLQFRSFPLAFHPKAPLAHEAAMTAAKEGRFWEFTSYILEHQDSLREQDLIAYAGHLGLDEQKFAQTLRDHRYAPRVDSDLSDGFRRGALPQPQRHFVALQGNADRHNQLLIGERCTVDQDPTKRVLVQRPLHQLSTRSRLASMKCSLTVVFSMP